MNRSLVMFLVLQLTIGSAAIAKADAGRVVEGRYDAALEPYTFDCSQSGERGCLAIPTRAGETSFTASVTDAHGLPVLVEVWADSDGSGIDDVNIGSFCGQTGRPVSFQPGSELHFSVGVAYPYERAGWVPDAPTTTSCPGGKAATTGTMQITLYAPDVDDAAPQPAPDPTPSSEPSPSNEPTPIQRSVDLGLRRHLRATGSVISDDSTCLAEVPVLILRKRATEWMEVGSTTTDAEGRFSLRVTDRPGRYRASAPEFAVGDLTCSGALSSTASHRH